MAFQATSRDIRLSHDKHHLEARCTGNGGSPRSSSINLNDCIGNLNGYFSWHERNFSHTAEDIQLEDRNGQYWLTANLKGPDGYYNPARQGINLSDHIQNNDGHLRCTLDLNRH